jgi:hypothetical protein
MDTETRVTQPAETDDAPPPRGPRGEFLPGYSYNPGGTSVRRQRADVALLQAMQEEWTPESTLALVREAEQIARETKSWKGLIKCAELRMAYTMGTPVRRQINMNANLDDRLREWLVHQPGEGDETIDAEASERG